MAVNFTKEQKQAIETEGTSILVSAAAGSGKTAILVERILRIILEGRANVDELLVVTFTRAAASEMKLRLSRLIRKHMAAHPNDAPMLRDQLSRMYRAYITSIDSFANRIDKEFFYEIDIEPDFNTCDEIQAELFKRDAADELISELFEHDDMIPGCGFREFMRLYSKEKSEESFKQEMISAYNKLRTMPDYFEWARSRAELLLVTPDTLEGSELEGVMAAAARDAFAVAFDAACRTRRMMEEAGLGDFYEEKLSEEVGWIHDIYTELCEGNFSAELTSRISSFNKFVTLRSNKAVREAYEPIKEDIKLLRDSYKKSIKDWNNSYLGSDLETRLREMNDTYVYTVYYISLLEEFEKRYADKKRERRVIDFADMEHYAVSILRKDEAADVLRRRFKYIFVDEYQDTNNIQEYLISKIARPDNVFRVGDVKQSIYKFRQAEPEIFERVYREYSDPANEDGITIDLSRNFRTNQKTINYVNKVFGELMEGYDDRAKLYAGVECDEEYDFIPEVHILTEEGPEDVAPEDGDAGAASGVNDADIAAGNNTDEETEDISKGEAEAAYIADLVSRIVGTEFYDTKAGVVRRAEPGDIAILYRSVKMTGDILVRSLKEHSIQAHVEEAEKYFDTVEIGVAMSLLMCIDNMKRDVPLLASMHSQVFNWSPEELAAIRIAHNEHMHEVREAEKEKALDDGANGQKSMPYRRAAYWEALKWYMEEGPEGDIKDKARSTTETILGWRRLSRMMPLGDFVWKVLTDSGYYMAAGAMNGGARRQANLRTLADRAVRFGRESVSSLNSFVTFLDLLRQRDSGNFAPPAAGGSDNVVRISTIHKSKGLEYPFVIIGGMGRLLRHPGSDGQFSFEPSIGVGLRYVDPSRKYWRSTLMQCAIRTKTDSDVYKENLRVLYVAMTRARNKLYMVGTCKSEEDLLKYTPSPGSYLKVIRDVVRTPYNELFISPLDTTRAFSAGKHRTLPDPGDIELGAEAAGIYSEIERRFTYEYPYGDLLTAKAKYSVSQIRRMELEAAADQNRPVELDSTAAGNAANGSSALLSSSGSAAVSSGGSGIPYLSEVSNCANPDSAEDADGAVSGVTAEPGTDEEVIVSQADDEVVRLRSITELNKKRAASVDIGIAYHRIMEFLDFTKVIRRSGSGLAAAGLTAGGIIEAGSDTGSQGDISVVDEEYIKERADFLAANNAIDKDAYKYVQLSRIADFFRSDLGRRAADAAMRGTLMKEKPFTLRTGRAIGGADDPVTGTKGRPHSILVQGVIDCCFEEDGKMVLLDYKSSFVRPGRRHQEELERIRNEYRVQLELYAEAIRKGTGMDVDEAYLYLFTNGELLEVL